MPITEYDVTEFSYIHGCSRVTARCCLFLIHRDQAGFSKYGKTLDEQPLDGYTDPVSGEFKSWDRMLAEELGDALAYEMKGKNK